MQTLKSYITSNLIDIDDTLVVSMDDTVQDVVRWLLTQEDKDTLIDMINTMDSNNKL